MSDAKDLKDQWLKLCEEIRHHDHLYFIEHAPVISDHDYDKLMSQLKDLERKHPNLINSHSPTQRVGEALTEGFQTKIHRTPMLSLANTYDVEEVEDFVARVHKLLGHRSVEFVCELKMDGIAISATYEEGKLVQATTRGDGRQGDDITTNLRTIKSLPLMLQGSYPKSMDVRGEVFMSAAVFQKLNDYKSQIGEELWANPRNAAAGSLKLLDPRQAQGRQLSVVFYGIGYESEKIVQKQWQVHQTLKSWGLPVLKQVALCSNVEEIMAYAEKIKKLRPSFGFDIDGVVVKVNRFEQQNELGMTAKSPRWAVAYKFAPEQAQTKVEAITIQIGRTGVLTPVAELTPVLLAGSTISRATLHNEEEVRRKDIRVGDTVLIEKGGDVIPKVTTVVTAHRQENSLPWQMPEMCPSCGAFVQRIENEVAVRCPNRGFCPEQRLRRFQFFVSKEALDIDNLGERVIAQLVEKGFVKRYVDLFLLTETELCQLDGFKEKSIHNLLKSLAKAKETSLARFLMGLGIKHVGIGTAEAMALKAGTLPNLMQMSVEQLMQIEGIGEKVAKSVVDYFVDPVNCQEIEDLLKAGVSPMQEQRTVDADSSHLFYDKTFVITGTIAGYSRIEAADLVKQRGGRVTESVTKKTQFLVVGDDPGGSKMQKANTLGVPILTQEQFLNLAHGSAHPAESGG